MPWIAPFFTTSWRHASSWVSALQTRLFGRSGLFRPRLPELLWISQPSLYDLRPLRVTIEEFVDFDRLNDGAVRLSICTTDAETGQPVMFDTAAGDRITADHLLASCGFFPDFPPTGIAGRLLADGGFSANAPIEAVLGKDEGTDLLCFLVDLFSPHGMRPNTIEEGASRQWELLFGNQTRDKLKGMASDHRLHLALSELAGRLGPDFHPDATLGALLAPRMPASVNVLHLAYRPKAYEAVRRSHSTSHKIHSATAGKRASAIWARQSSARRTG
jgi:NTE family protein